MKKLNCDEARQISIVDYLAQCGITPQNIKGANHWYLSPIREENTPSFKVNTNLNSWYDHGIGEGGNFIDLGIRLHQCTVEELLARVSVGDRSFSFHQPVKHAIQAGPESKIVIHDASELHNLGLVDYLHERGVDYYTAKAYCKEVLFSVGGQRHLALGFVNRSGGYELRNSAIKLSSSPKDLTFIDRGFDTVHVTEGFTDFLSLLTINRRDMAGNFLVLNSLSFVSASLEILRQHKVVELYLDHDKAAVKAIAAIKEIVPNVNDASRFYSGHKDLNAYLTQEHQQRQTKGLHL
jgi:hypothetical protein